MYENIIISDPVAANCIIDQSSLENVLLAPDSNAAMHLTSDRRNVPRNCRQVLTIEGDVYYPDPNYRTYAARRDTAKFLQANVEDRLK